MSSDRVSIDGMAAAIMEGLEEYAELATADMKKAVRKAGSNIKKDIEANAPKKTGDERFCKFFV